jgi:hypothetical protein
MSVKSVLLDGNSLPIMEFKLDSLCPNPSICMIAKRGSGKSWVCRSIIHHFRDIPVGVIIAPTDLMNSFYGKFFPESFIHYEYRSDIIENLLFRQKKMIDKMKKKYGEKKKCNPRAFLVMDDCLSSKGSWMKDQPIMDMFFNGRHYQVTYILTMQFPLGIKPELRCNFDYIFLLGEDFCSNQKRLYDHYAGMFPNFNTFKDVFLQLTSNYGSMVIVNRGVRTNILEKIFFYRAKNIKMKSIGCDQINDYSKNNYNPDWNTNDDFNVDKFMDCKNKSKIKIAMIKTNSDKE